MNAQGVDVSYAQGAIDWPKVAASGISFAFCKATEGLTITDSRVGENVCGATGAKVLTGLYHFARPGSTHPEDARAVKVIEDAVAEARHFLAVYDGHRALCDLPPALDLEANDRHWTARAMGEWALAWLREVATHVPRPQLSPPMLYSTREFLTPIVQAVPKLSAYRLWQAGYPDPSVPWQTFNLRLPPHFASWHCWQRTDKGSVPGIAGDVDLDVWCAPIDALRKGLGLK